MKVDKLEILQNEQKALNRWTIKFLMPIIIYSHYNSRTNEDIFYFNRT